MTDQVLSSSGQMESPDNAKAETYRQALIRRVFYLQKMAERLQDMRRQAMSEIGEINKVLGKDGSDGRTREIGTSAENVTTTWDN